MTEAARAFEPGAIVISNSASSAACTSGTGLCAVAAVNPDQTTGLYVSNPTGSPVIFTVDDAGYGFSYSLPANSVVSFRWTNPPSTSVLLPAAGATLSANQVLDAVASSGVSQVQFEVSGNGMTDDVIGTAVPTIVGWLDSWNTTGVANGTYTLQSVASYAGGVSGTSPPITVTVANP